MSLQLVYEDALTKGQAQYSGRCQGFSQLQSLQHMQQVNLTPYYGIISTEPDSWRLNGWHLPVEQQYIPYWGDVCSDAEGMLPPDTGLQVQLQQPVSASGITLRFWPEDNQWVSCFTVRWFLDQQLLEEKTFYPTSADFTCRQRVLNFDRLQFVWQQTNLPFRFPKLQGLVIGQKLIFGEENLVNIRLSQLSDPVDCTLSADPMTVELSGVEIAPQQQQKVWLYADGNCIAQRLITSTETLGSDHCILQCETPLRTLEDRFWGGFYQGESAGFVAEQILQAQFSFHMDASLAVVPIYGYLGLSTRRKALQQLAFVLGARMVYQEDMLKFFPFDTALTQVEAPEVFLGGQMKTQPPMVGMEVTAHSYRWDTQERLLLENVPVHGENIRLPLSRPACDCRIEGGQLGECDINYVTVTADGPVSIWGVPLLHSKTVHSRGWQGIGNRVTVSSNTLISPENVQSVMDRLTDAYSHRQRLQQHLKSGQYYAGQRLTLPTPWGGSVTGHVVELETDLKTTTVTVLGTQTM